MGRSNELVAIYRGGDTVYGESIYTAGLNFLENTNSTKILHSNSVSMITIKIQPMAIPYLMPIKQ